MFEVYGDADSEFHGIDFVGVILRLRADYHRKTAFIGNSGNFSFL